MVSRTMKALVAGVCIMVAGASVAQAEVSAKADKKTSNSYADSPQSHPMMAHPMMMKKKHHKAM